MDFIILKVNGQDLSKATHEEAVEAFRTAKEPIVVEVLRRVSKTPSASKNVNSNQTTVGTQTEMYIETQPSWCIPRLSTPPPTLYSFTSSSLVEPASRRPVAILGNDMLTDIEIANGFEFQDESFDDDRVFELEYEEITLHRGSSEDKLGLTLCYGSGDDIETDIFVSEVEPYSIAGQDGRIREGDQIIQINGVDVHTRNQAISLFTESRPDITLLLARPNLQVSDCFLDDLQMDMLEQFHNYNVQFTGNHLEQVDEEGGTTDTATTENMCNQHEKDSGVGRTDESTRNDESSEQEIMENDITPPGGNSKFNSECGLRSGELHYSNDSFTSNEHDYITNEISAEECEKFREVLETRCSQTSSSEQNISALRRTDSESSIDKELAMLNKEMEDIHLECQTIVQAHAKEEQKVRSQSEHTLLSFKSDESRSSKSRSGGSIKSGKHDSKHDPSEPVWVKNNCHAKSKDKITSKTNEIKQSDEDKEKDSSSAYNTGESCRSTPLTLELNHICEETGREKRNSTLITLPPKQDDKENKQKSRNEEKRSTKDIGTEKDSSSDSGRNYVTMYPNEIMYTNRANLQHTILLQQRLFRQALLQQAHQRQAAKHNSTPPSTSGDFHGQSSKHMQQNQNEEPQMEWKVKRRADGTRYIARRPVRNRILKERAHKLQEERCGMTTDDDAMSELKIGRYWTKEERKRHLERAKDQKRRREFMMRSRMESVKEHANENGDGKKEVNILELSHKKMMKKKGKRLFDDFTTVQEVLAHGSRSQDGSRMLGLLSVTTV